MEQGGNVIVVTVTYGNRINLLDEVISVLRSDNYINEIIVINNGSSTDLKKYFETNSKVRVVDLLNNTGSANGFNVGIEMARANSNCEYIWLLDDDNKPENNALELLISYYNDFKEKYKKNEFSLLSLREDRKEYILASKFRDSSKYFPSNNSFLGIHFKDLIKKVINRIHKKNVFVEKEHLNIVDVPLAPYGGFFFHKDLVDEIGLPNKEFYLYSDDYEFSYRVTKRRGKIFLVPESKISDIDKTWFNKDNSGFLLSLFKSKSDFRIFYSIRNRVYFEKKDLVNNKFIYILNKIFFLLIISILAIIYKNSTRRDLIIKAIKLGEEGKLGEIKKGLGLTDE